MTSEPRSRFLIDLYAAACERLPAVECITLTADGGKAPCELVVGLPLSYARHRRRYPLAIVFDGQAMCGSVIEMSRLMADTREIRESLVVVVRTPTHQWLAGSAPPARAITALLAALARRYRIDGGPVLAFAGGDGAAAPALAAAADPRLRLYGEGDHGIAAFVDALRRLLSTGIEYGRGMPALRRPWWTPLLRACAPLARRLMRPPTEPPGREGLHRLRSHALDRDFEIFVWLPQAASLERPVPALFVLDASIEFSTVAEAAYRLAAAGSIEPVAVIGVGVPRAEGHYGFAFRRFEEFSPMPSDGYAWGDDLGHIFRALFALRGEDARLRLGRAPDLLTFLTDELLPVLLHLPIDTDALGLLGHSAGGTFVGYALAQPRSPFRDYIGVSPGIAIGGDWLLRALPSAHPALRTRSARFVIGGEERINAFNVIAGIPRTRSYVEQLCARGIDARYGCYDGETHSSIYPRAVEDALKAVYARPAVDRSWRSA
ncbi:alpha/beta hydrolase [Sinimarinibacterium thermocellulolyticum]|uniref:Esterase n=1 Tax=Sinimarinibacterium thermocellulolyticum TaxID=3170016 RepID=A0ABV2AF37_9GAMM